MTTAFIALGSNLSSPPAQLRSAVAALRALPQSSLENCSCVYRSQPVGPAGQPDYLNAVVQLDTQLAPLALLDALQCIENAQGRERTVRWGPRTLDLDILLFGDATIASERLSVPHPSMQQRSFVLLPLRDITGPDWVLPDGSVLGTLVMACDAAGLEKTNLSLCANGPGREPEDCREAKH